jgi:hypothetical protein
MKTQLVWQPLQLLCFVWGVGGVVGVLCRGIWRMWQIAVGPYFESHGTPTEWIILALWAGFMAYSEGYRGFQKAFSPRVVARAIYIGQHPTILRVLFAPAICMGLVFATRKRLTVSWCLLIGVVGLVVAIQTLEQPWRGVIDAGVVVGLSWGVLSLVALAGRALLGHATDTDPEVPLGVTV